MSGYPASLRVVLEHPSGATKSLLLGLSAQEPIVPLSEVIRRERAFWRRYTDAGWVVQAIYGVYYDAHGRSRMRPLESLLVVMAEVVGPGQVLRPVGTFDRGQSRRKALASGKEGVE